MRTVTGAISVRGRAFGEIPPSKETLTVPSCSTSACATAARAKATLRAAAKGVSRRNLDEPRGVDLALFEAKVDDQIVGVGVVVVELDRQFLGLALLVRLQRLADLLEEGLLAFQVANPFGQLRRVSARLRHRVDLAHCLA